MSVVAGGWTTHIVGLGGLLKSNGGGWVAIQARIASVTTVAGLKTPCQVTTVPEALRPEVTHVHNGRHNQSRCGKDDSCVVEQGVPIILRCSGLKGTCGYNGDFWCR